MPSLELMVIAFVDLSRFLVVSAELGPMDSFRLVDQFVGHVGREVVEGRVIKFIGDAALIVWPPSKAELALRELRSLKGVVDGWLQSQDLECRLQVRVHTGEVAAGELGIPGQKAFDVIGPAVNHAARMSGDFVLSQEFSKLLGQT